MTEGVRFPTFAFITGGSGQSDDGIPPQPFETFCYDSALLQARIENFNIVPYTSVLPKELHGKIIPLNDKISSAPTTGYPLICPPSTVTISLICTVFSSVGLSLLLLHAVVRQKANADITHNKDETIRLSK